MYTLAVTPLLFTLRLPLRLAVYVALYVLVPRLPDSATYGSFLLGLAVADVDETSTALRRLPLSKARAVQLGLGALRAYLLAIWATGQGRFYGWSWTVILPELRRVEGAVCLFVFLHLTPSVCGALDACWPLRALGRLSVGLWLFHSIVLSSAGAAVLVWLHGQGLGYTACVAGVFVATVAISLLLSSIFNTTIEQPLETCLGYMSKLIFMGSAPRPSPSAKDVPSGQVPSSLLAERGSGTQ
jgi:peptidoglycan/LPS O-acetylase OafA/YrhL